MSHRMFLLSGFLFALSCASTAYYTAQLEDEPEDAAPKQAKMIELADIDRDDLAVVKRKIAMQYNQGVRLITLRVNSNGGSIFAGLDFIQYLEDMKKRGVKLRCVVDTRAISMGFVILQAACDERLATDRAFFLAHNGTVGGQGGTSEDLQEDLDLLNTLNESMAKIVAKRLGMPLEDYKKLLRDKKSWIFDADEALRVHAVDRLVDPMSLPLVDE